MSLNGYVNAEPEQQKPQPLNTSPQYGLQSAFSQIERKSHSVLSAGNPIELDMSTFYKVKGVGKETTINSKVNIFHENGKITRVEDKWDGKLPDSGIANVSKYYGLNVFNPIFWFNYGLDWWFSIWLFLYKYVPFVLLVRSLSGSFLLDSCASSYLPIYVILLSLCMHTNKSSLGLPPPQRCQCPENGRRAQERRGGRQTRQLEALLGAHIVRGRLVPFRHGCRRLRAFPCGAQASKHFAKLQL